MHSRTAEQASTAQRSVGRSALGSGAALAVFNSTGKDEITWQGLQAESSENVQVYLAV